MPEVIYRKYRPSTFASVTGQEHVATIVQNQIKQGTIGHAYLFSGPRGIGKTTIARLIAKSLNCQNRKDGEAEPCNECQNCTEANAGRALDIIEIDAASNTGVDNVRETVIDAVRFAPAGGKYKIYIIDEVHMLSTSAFNALLKTLEEPPAHAIFILATTELHKIPDTIISRCQRFDFRRIPADLMTGKLKEVLQAEGAKADDAVLRAIVRVSEGCLRDAESLLGQLLALGEKHLKMEHASLLLPMTDVTAALDMLEAGLGCDTNQVMQKLQEYVEQGASMVHLHNTLIDLCRDALFLALGGPKNDLVDEATTDRLKVIAGYDSTKLKRLLDSLLAAKAKPKHDAIPQLLLELAFLEVCENASSPPELGGVRGGMGTQTAPGSHPAKYTSSSVQNQPTFSHSEQSEVSLAAADAVDSNIPANTKTEIIIDIHSDEPPKIRPESVPDKDPNPVEAVNASSNISSSSGTELDLRDLQSKWKRCCAAVAKRSISLPLMLQSAMPHAIEDKTLIIAFTHSFYYETINQPKHLDTLAEAINEVMQSNIHVKPLLVHEESEVQAQEIASAFGGAVVD